MQKMRSLLVVMAGVLIATETLTVPAEGAAIAWQQNLQQASRQSAAEHKPLLVMVKASWCGPCHQMLEQTFPDPAVAERVNQQFVPVLIDADEQAATTRLLGVDAMPTVVVISPEHKITSRIVGFQSAAQFNSRLAQLVLPKVTPVNRLMVRRPATSPNPQPRGAQAGSSFLQRHSVKVPSRE